MAETHRAHCLCGDIRITVTGALPAPDACHCSQCRRQSGHVWASTDVPRDAVRIDGEDAVRWYRSSEKVRRGFCGRCGSLLFWDVQGRDRLAIAMGAFELPTGTRLSHHIFTADKGDYYDIAGDAPQEGQPPAAGALAPDPGC